jgi:hypothetical protein
MRLGSETYTARARLAASQLVAEVEHRARWLRSPLRPVTRAYVETYGLTVRDGPFAGLCYPAGVISHVTTAVPKLMGSYERELHEVIERVIASRPAAVITAGCADGYYAVGLARRLPGATVYGFDLEPRWRRICRRLAERNGVGGNVEIGELLDGPTLRRLPLGQVFVLIDCDGCEETLFSAETVGQLRACTVVVETHDAIVPGVTERLLERFAASHAADVIEAEPRWISDFPDIETLAGLSYVDRELGITEFRPQQRWVVFTPKRP